MFVRSTRLNYIISFLILVIGACGGVGSGCDACGSTQPLPAPGSAPHIKNMPADQTVEGGAQMRVTQQGFQKLTNLLPQLLEDSGLGDGFCIPQGSVGSCGGFPDTGACYCVNDNTTCGNNHCKADVGINSLSVSVPSQNTLRVQISATLSTQIQIKGSLLGANLGTCTLNISSPSLGGTFDIALGVKPADGELDLRLASINQFSLNLDISGCGFLGDIANLVSSLLDSIINSFVGNFILDLLRPTVDDLLQSLLPNPLGIAGMMDVGNLVEQVSPGTSASLEARIVPGGYAFAQNGGMSLGVITGLNADLHTETRDIGLTSEPSLCVPPFSPPNLGPGGAGLAKLDPGRQTFALGVANEFNGSIDNQDIPGSSPPLKPDVLMGISETTLDLAGHHAVSSGMMCLGVGTNFIEQLNVGTIGILVPSVAELQSENNNDPLLLVTRPQRPIDFTIGDNNGTSPALTLGLTNLEVDFYAFLFERYTRVFTLDLTMAIGLGLDFQLSANGTPQIVPTLSGISAENITVKVINSQFVRETPMELEAVLPTVFDLVTPLLGSLDPIDMPTFAGFTLDNLNISKVTTAQDDFLALRATLGAQAALAKLNNQFPADKLRDQAAEVLRDRTQVSQKSQRATVTTPPPHQVRNALLRRPDGAMPKVVFDVDKVDAQGRTLEWTYQLENGLFRPWVTPGPGGLVIEDRAFAWQGKYDIGLKSRVKGNYKTSSEIVTTKVIVDSVGPRFLTEKAEWDGDTYKLTIFDIVSGNVVQWALGKPDSDGPDTKWFDGGYAQIRRADLEALAVNGEVVVYARDEAGNVNQILIAPFHGSPSGEGGCECNSSNPTAGGIALMLFVGLVLIGRPGRRLARVVRTHRRAAKQLAMWAGLSAVLSVVPACSCGNAQSCEVFSDCAECPEGEIAFCIDGTCVCSDDIVLGRLGPYSDVGVGADGSIWVSAYHAQYGDLVVAKVEPTVGRIPDTSWEWVDGVPEGPVIVPQSAFRGGIAAKGEDVGMYTSIAVRSDGTPVVTYFDRDTGSLKFAARDAAGVWTHHTIEQGTGELGEAGALIGMYTSLSLRSDNGFPGVAYLAHVADAQQGRRAQVRFASAQTTNPTSGGDWMTFIVDDAPLPVEDPANPNIYPLPEGLGLFVDLARAPDQSPVVVYYDRTNGELKLNKFDVSAGAFGATPVVLDGAGDFDAGWSPSVGVDPNGVVHVAYVDATNDDLVYITDAPGAVREIVDDGRRIVGVNNDGLPKPEFHFVGDDASLVLANGLQPMIVYQDATTQELLMVTKQQSGAWDRVSIAGATDPWPGGYGFFAANQLFGADMIMSTWVIDQPNDDNWVEVFRRQVVIQ